MRSSAMPIIAMFLVGVAGCASSSSSASGDGSRIVTSRSVPHVQPALAVERFLRAANANDLRTMAQLFGTEEGPIANRDPAADVERRMFALASLLRHTDFQLRGERMVPGRLGQAIEVEVEVRTSDDRSARVPFILVQAAPDHWLIEQIDVQRLVSR